MATVASPWPPITREQVIHGLHEAAELEHDLMCTYLYAAFSLKAGVEEGLSEREAAAVARWRRTILRVATEEMGHLTAVWNITSGLGAAPRFGRDNFPLPSGTLPAGVIVRLAPFDADVVQHFIHLERPATATDPDGRGFAPVTVYRRAVTEPRLTPMGLDYATVGAFYASLQDQLRALVAEHGERAVFCGDPALQLSSSDTGLAGLAPVRCAATALRAFAAIVEQGEGAPGHSERSHFAAFQQIRDELVELRTINPAFVSAHPVARDPVLRPPVVAASRVWIEHEEAAETVDLANAVYGQMLRLLAYAYRVPGPAKRLAVTLALGAMRAFSHLAERAARLPAGPSHPGINAGVSFTALRDAAAFPDGSDHVFIERFEELAAVAARLDRGDARMASARRLLDDLVARGRRGFVPGAVIARPAQSQPVMSPPPTPDGERVEGTRLAVLYDDARCIHSRHCVTWGPKVFLANVTGPWIQPDAMDVEAVVQIAHVCPSGAIRYVRKDGHPDEQTPPVNLVALRENGPYAIRAELRIAGVAADYRATLCRCGASKRKPYCDSSHKTIAFSATGEPPSTAEVSMLDVRDGVLDVEPEVDGPLRVTGNLEVTAGTGRVVARVTRTRLCRCGASETKPFCDGSHGRVGFRSG